MPNNNTFCPFDFVPPNGNVNGLNKVQGFLKICFMQLYYIMLGPTTHSAVVPVRDLGRLGQSSEVGKEQGTFIC